MLRLTELALFLAPLAAFAAWWLLAARGGPSNTLLLASALALCVLAAALIWVIETQRLPRGTTYVPAALQDGRIVPGHAAPTR